jgi:O-acetyl-ADP-ribose deacetylase (regulator of RNase III)
MIQVTLESLMEVRVEGVVRPIRSDLTPVNGVSRDLGVAAGVGVAERLAKVGPLPLGGAVVTPGGELPAHFMIHVVVMSEDEPQTEASVQRALQNGLRRASDFGMQSLAVPALGMGVGLTEPEVSARALVDILFHHIDEGRQPLALTISVSSPYEASLFERLVEELGHERAGH